MTGHYLKIHPDFVLFNRFHALALELRSTAAVVQNDHDRLIADEMISKVEVHRNLRQFVERSEDHIAELQSLQIAVVRRLDAVIAALQKKSVSFNEGSTVRGNGNGEPAITKPNIIPKGQSPSSSKP